MQLYKRNTANFARPFPTTKTPTNKNKGEELRLLNFLQVQSNTQSNNLKEAHVKAEADNNL